MTKYTESVVGAAHPTVDESVVGEAHPTFCVEGNDDHSTY